MKRLFQPALFMLAMLASASSFALTLTANPYSPPPTGQTLTPSLTVDGTAAPGCTMASVSGGLVPTCAIPSLAVGTHTLVLTVTSSAATCPPPPTVTTQTCYLAGSASSAPFSLTISAAAGAPTGLQAAP